MIKSKKEQAKERKKEISNGKCNRIKTSNYRT